MDRIHAGVFVEDLHLRGRLETRDIEGVNRNLRLDSSHAVLPPVYVSSGYLVYQRNERREHHGLPQMVSEVDSA